MMKKIWILLLGAMSVLSACSYTPPSVSSNVVGTDPNGGALISISTSRCAPDLCADMVLKKASEICPNGYIVKNHQSSRLSSGILTGNEQMIIRCSN